MKGILRIESFWIEWTEWENDEFSMIFYEIDVNWMKNLISTNEVVFSNWKFPNRMSLVGKWGIFNHFLWIWMKNAVLTNEGIFSNWKFLNRMSLVGKWGIFNDFLWNWCKLDEKCCFYKWSECYELKETESNEPSVKMTNIPIFSNIDLPWICWKWVPKQRDREGGH